MQRFRIITRRGKNKWQWVLMDWQGQCLDAGGGCPTRDAASLKGAEAKAAYLKKDAPQDDRIQIKTHVEEKVPPESGAPIGGEDS